ncbi:MAG TPA: efflux RND transporter periplasmic adaptor subunit [Kofleriaceae bacterium]|nr:efflux RND transporter periplasmic adaptor subunit [Kofleriaceae bacterium]
MISIIAGLVVLVGGIWGYRAYKAREEGDVQYQVAPVARGELASQVTASGTLSPLVTVQVGSQVSGRIKDLFADFNARVHKGQVLAKIDPELIQSDVTKARANLAAARAAVTHAEADRSQAKLNNDRQKALAAKSLVAQADADNALAALKAADAQVDAAKASLSQARAALTQSETNLAYTTIVSPIDGVVISRDVNVGQTVAASLQAPTLFTLAEDLAKMEVHTSVAESDVGRLSQGMDVEFTVDAYPSDRFHATVKEVRYSPTTVQNVVTYDAVVSVDNRELKLRPGMTADVTFLVEKRDNALMVPNAALRFRPPPDVLARIGWKGPQGGDGRGAQVGARSVATSDPPAGAGGAASAPATGSRGNGSGSGSGNGSGNGNGSEILSGGAAAGAGGAAARSADGARRGRGGADRANRRLVWTLGEDGAPKPAMVQIGISDGRQTEIVKGLDEGDQIITGVVGAGASQADQSQGGGNTPGQRGGGGGGRRGGMGRFL